MNVRLRPAHESDIPVLMNWFQTERECKTWGGPEFDFPFDRVSFTRDVKWPQLDSYSLVRPDDGLLGFGQYYEKQQRVHLARLVVAPDFRGRGLGVELVGRLLETGREKLGRSDGSLYVMEHNAAALSCYRSLGFELHPPPENDVIHSGVVFMVLRSEPQTSVHPG